METQQSTVFQSILNNQLQPFIYRILNPIKRLLLFLLPEGLINTNENVEAEGRQQEQNAEQNVQKIKKIANIVLETNLPVLIFLILSVLIKMLGPILQITTTILLLIYFLSTQLVSTFKCYLI